MLNTSVYNSNCSSLYMMTFIGQFKLDLRSRSGNDLIGGEGDGHIACQTTRLDQTSSLVPLTSLAPSYRDLLAIDY